MRWSAVELPVPCCDNRITGSYMMPAGHAPVQLKSKKKPGTVYHKQTASSADAPAL